MVKRFSLVPVEDGYEECLNRILDVVGKSGVSLRECLDTDCDALCESDMRYFGVEYYGRVPSYGVFIKYLNKLPVNVKDDFMETIAEVESGRYVSRMDDLANGDFEEDPFLVKRFNMYDKLNGVQERRLNRIDARRKARGEGESRGIDMAARLISALKDADLLKIKGDMEIIDSEFKEVASD